MKQGCALNGLWGITTSAWQLVWPFCTCVCVPRAAGSSVDHFFCGGCPSLARALLTSTPALQSAYDTSVMLPFSVTPVP